MDNYKPLPGTAGLSCTRFKIATGTWTEAVKTLSSIVMLDYGENYCKGVNVKPKIISYLVTMFNQH